MGQRALPVSAIPSSQARWQVAARWAGGGKEVGWRREGGGLGEAGGRVRLPECPEEHELRVELLLELIGSVEHEEAPAELAAHAERHDAEGHAAQHGEAHEDRAPDLDRLLPCLRCDLLCARGAVIKRQVEGSRLDQEPVRRRDGEQGGREAEHGRKKVGREQLVHILAAGRGAYGRVLRERATARVHPATRVRPLPATMRAPPLPARFAPSPRSRVCPTLAYGGCKVLGWGQRAQGWVGGRVWGRGRDEPD